MSDFLLSGDPTKCSTDSENTCLNDTVHSNTIITSSVPSDITPLHGNPIEEDRCPKLDEITMDLYGLPGFCEANIVFKNFYAGATSDRSHKDIHGVPITKQSFENIGITFFISLQEEHEERHSVYGEVNHYDYPVDRYPVKDMSVTDDDVMIACSQNIFNKLAEGEVIYLHCQAGLGRTGVIVCIVLALKFGIDADHALILCQKMKDCRCRSTPYQSPQTEAQVDQVKRIIEKMRG
jgi:protein-tyrosine phosphatase